MLADDGIARLRKALADYSVDTLYSDLAPDAADALGRGDLARLRRTLGGRPERLTTLVRLFILADPVDEAAAAAALHPLALDEAVGGGLLARSADSVRALVDLRPYHDDRLAADWWLVSDFGSDVRPGPVAADHVLGLGSAGLTLVATTVPVSGGRALDIGTGCGIGALPLAAQGAAVVATDINPRALAMAATTAALAGQTWDLRRGSLTTPVAGERFDTIVSNPPFVVSPGWAGAGEGYDYRDSGRTGDDVVRDLLNTLPGLLAPGGTAQLLANWLVPPDGAWDERLRSWLTGRGVDAWIWQREVLSPVDYVTLWLRDAGEEPGSPRWDERFDRWLSWFRAAEVPAIGIGIVTLRRTDRTPVLICEDVPQVWEGPAGPEIAGWLARTAWLADVDDDGLLSSRLRVAEDVSLVQRSVANSDGWVTVDRVLEQQSGLRFSVPADDAVTAVLAGCDGHRPLAVLAAVLAAALGAQTEAVAAALLQPIRELVRRGLLLPVEVDP